jgi:hypothetical protein
MALYEMPLEAILKAIKTQNNVTLVEAEYLYADPVVIPTGASGENTSMTITAKDVQSTYDGSVPILYKRLDLADLGTLIDTSIKGYNLTTILDVANRLNKLYGLNFTADDFTDGPTGLVDGVGTITLTAKTTSRYWIGSVDITVAQGQRPLEAFLTVTSLPGLNYPAPSIDKPYAAAYSYWQNFSASAVALETVLVGVDQIDVVRDVLTAITKNVWSSTAAGRYSVMGATVTYAGVTTGRTDVNTDYEKVIIVQLNETNSVGLSGSLYLHYNPPAVD